MRLRLEAVGFLPSLLLCVLLVSPLPLPRPHRTSDPHPILAGSWMLNPMLSRSPGQHRSRGPGGGGGGHPGEAPGEGGFGGGFSRGMLGGSRGLGELLRPKEQLAIAQTDTLITVADDAGWIRELIPSGQRMREELGQGGPADVLTRWKGAKLIADRFLDGGGTYSEAYELNRKTGRLTLRISFRAGRMPRAIEETRVYEKTGSNE